MLVSAGVVMARRSVRATLSVVATGGQVGIRSQVSDMAGQQWL